MKKSSWCQLDSVSMLYELQYQQCTAVYRCVLELHIWSLSLNQGFFIVYELNALSPISALNKSPSPSHTQPHKSPQCCGRSDQETTKSVTVWDYEPNELLVKSCWNYILDWNPWNKNIFFPSCSSIWASGLRTGEYTLRHTSRIKQTWTFASRSWQERGRYQAEFLWALWIFIISPHWHSCVVSGQGRAHCGHIIQHCAHLCRQAWWCALPFSAGGLTTAAHLGLLFLEGFNTL